MFEKTHKRIKEIQGLKFSMERGCQTKLSHMKFEIKL
jgi:hypothetical protein